AAVTACSDDAGSPVNPTSSTTPDTGTGNTPEASTNTDDGGDGGTTAAQGCEADFTAAECKAMKTFSPLPAVPADPTNAFADNAAAAVLGQGLFFDKSFSGALAVAGDLGAIGDTGKVACVTCHSSKATDDGRTPNNVSLGTDYGTRNALPIVNSSFYKW